MVTKLEAENSKKFFKKEAPVKGHFWLKVAGAIALLSALIVMLGGLFIGSIGALLTGTGLGAFAGLPIVVIGVLVIIYAVFIFWYGVSLLKERTWAYYLLYVGAIFNVFVSLITLSIFGVITSGVVVIYCWWIGGDMNPAWCPTAGKKSIWAKCDGGSDE